MTAARTRPALSFAQKLALIYGILFAAMTAVILFLSGGLFSYSLDDPYIHLALAQNIAHGHYGINLNEASSPSSSVLWPLLLAPFSHLQVAALVPLCLNALLSLGVCFLLGRFFEDWYVRLCGPVPSWQQWTLALLFVVAANLIGLTFVGMEHVLQILLVVACALGLLETYAGSPIPTVYLVLAALAPSVRYEDLAFTLGLALACWWQGRRLPAVLTLVAGTLPLLVFGWFLHTHGLGYLPNSVLVKGGVVAGSSPSHRAFAILQEHAHTFLFDPGAWPILIFAAALLIVAWRERRDPRHLQALLAALVAIGLMMAVGPYGWMYRYDVSVRLFSFLVLFAALASLRLLTPRRAIGLATLAAALYFVALAKAPFSARRMALEQRQMARFFHDYYRQDVAVNDLGWVSFNKSDSTRVLDLWGLASADAMNAVKDADWLDGITRRHNIGLVMICPGWFKGIPSSWTALAEFHQQPGPMNSDARRRKLGDIVVLYATPVADLPVLREEVTQFAATMPAGSWLTVPGVQMTSR